MFKILTQNIWGKNNHWQERANLIGKNMDEQAVDVLCIQETSPDHFEYLKTESFKAWEHAVYAPSDDATLAPGYQGLAMFSRHPIQNAAQYDLGREDHPNIDPWMRIIHAIQITVGDKVVTVFNTHLFLNQAQKQEGIAGCVRFMQESQFDKSIKILVGDLNIRLNKPEDLLLPLTSAGYIDIWKALQGDEAGLTWPLEHDKPPKVRLDGHFIHNTNSPLVNNITLANDKLSPITNIDLYLSDHIGVMGVYDFST